MKATLPEFRLELYLATKEFIAKEQRGASQRELLPLRHHLARVRGAIAALERVR